MDRAAQRRSLLQVARQWRSESLVDVAAPQESDGEEEGALSSDSTQSLFASQILALRDVVQRFEEGMEVMALDAETEQWELAVVLSFTEVATFCRWWLIF